MLRHWFLPLTLGSWLVACGGTPDSYVEGRIFGIRNGGPVDVAFRFTNGGIGGLVYENFLRDDRRGNDPTFIHLSDQDHEVTVREWSGPEPIDEDTFELFLWELPSPPVHAGNHRGAILGVRLNDSFVFGPNPSYDVIDMEYEELEWTGNHDGSVISRGHLSSHFTSDPGLRMEGRFQLVANCEWNPFHRFCGQPRIDNPKIASWQQSDCPQALIEHVGGQAVPDWKGDSRMRLGAVDYACKGEDGLLQCFADVSGIEAEGCTWRAVVLTDGSVDQFALAGFADPACSRHACNTWR